ncbi:branched-chain-amino-acid transaminase [Synchytrium endobioticum]|uniref:Branched-chain-amino-acid transaminase n=1 Tax=Synchytrium endobioticum TaxID=286115 RepID=A0A507DQ24_9FUNG|nr:branched-chain-amino-acid transaminase [Synchytrium endobioticum]TPX53481.1 branched-chain-amino-acid transaminase [Synchytrium endobioticum]
MTRTESIKSEAAGAAAAKPSSTVNEHGFDFSSMGFSWVATNSFIKYVWKEGNGWDAGELVRGKDHLDIHVSATALHYGQAAFEGMKAFQMRDGKIRLFRPQMNAKRLRQSCEVSSMVAPSEELFLEALSRLIRDNREWVPPPESGGSAYVRPFIFGSGASLGLVPATEYTFIAFLCPVGDFYKGGMGSPATALIKHQFDRAAPYGTGHVKLGGNYPAPMGPTNDAKKRGYTVLLFLDAAEHRFVEEFATSNFAALTSPDSEGKRTYVTPKSQSILPSVTNRSLMELAHKHFGWNVERRVVEWDEVKRGCFDEVAACGTAVVITPVGEIHREVSTGGKRRRITVSSIANGIGNADNDEGKMAKTCNNDIEVTDSSSSGNAQSAFYGDGVEEYEDETVLEVTKLRGSDFEGFRALLQAYRELQNGGLENWQEYGWMWPAEGF